MIDSSGGLPSGLLQGSWTNLGAFDECLSLPSSQYCLVNSRVPLPRTRKYEGFFRPLTDNLPVNSSFNQLISSYGHYFIQMNITTGLCLPQGCSTNELNLLLRSALNKHQSGLQFSVDICQTHSESIPWLKHEIIVVTIIVFVICANIIGTLLPSTPLLGHFNVFQNLTKTISPVQRSPVTCLAGIKTLTMAYLICGHIVWGFIYNSFNHLFAFPSTLVNPIGLGILLGPSSLETFFLVGGLEMMTFFMDKSPSSLSSLVSFPTFILLRWLRFSITVGWFICVYIIVFSDHFRVLIGGPFWYYLQAASSISSTCASTWFNHLLLIAHHFNTPENLKTCLLADWYLEVDFIYSIIFIIILKPYLADKPILSIVNSILIIVVGITITTLITIKYDVQTSWLPTNFFSNQFTKYLVYIHSKPWAHVSPYFMGVILALVLNSDKPKVNKKLIPYGWFIFWLSISTIFLYEIIININLITINRSLTILYGSTSRLLWSIIIGWLIYSCHFSLTWSWLSNILSSRFLAVLSRVNLNALFANFLIVRLNNSTQRSLINFSLSTLLFSYGIPMVVETYLISFIFTILIDKPFTNLLINTIRKDLTINDNDNNNNRDSKSSITIKKC
ncbi:uncharacterized protein LOC128390468 isoform X2 [Panonychus citri]|nr:uncharacterized protein LOC128390468 isoform X2 [Panonychus citri]XP_053206166.1 uncharacterized protein LOC128390468 isoform X2 [Panonychus citri]XP_053206167.1 uncharacterized protein LOC128390468 isoform X2 [Panonychus citri]